MWAAKYLGIAVYFLTSQFATTPAHASRNTGWISYHQAVRRHVIRHYRPSGHHRVLTNAHATDNGGISSN